MDIPKHACFSYIMSKGKIAISFGKCITIGDYLFSYDENTPLQKSVSNERELILFGFAVDIRDGSSKELAETILRESMTINDVIRFEAWLGGKYLIVYSDNTGCYIIPDATASIPILYTVNGNSFVSTPYEQIIVDFFGFKSSSELQSIRNSSEISQAMPCDVTCYCEIKSLLPNHVLNCGLQTAARFVNSTVKQQEITAERAAEITEPYIAKIADMYVQQFRMYCPITGGKDSRVVLAYLNQACEKAGKGLLCYTMRHPYHKGNEDDLVIPKRLVDCVHLHYEQISDVPESSCAYAKTDSLLGKGCYSKRTAIIAETIQRHYGDGAIVNGDIIGQVGKCSLHRDIPEFLATSGYFKCKIHNYSRKANMYIKQWICDVQSAGECVNLFDLFSVESRLGRWAAQENVMYNIKGQLYLNVFNSRSIIYVWSCVPRKQRKNAEIQKALIRRITPELLEVPFETDHSIFIRLSKANGLNYYIGSRIKHCIGYIKFKFGSKEQE